MGTFNQKDKKGTTSIIGATTSGSGSGNGKDPIPGQSVQGLSGALSNLSETGTTTKQYKHAMNRYVNTIDKALDSYYKVNTTDQRPVNGMTAEQKVLKGKEALSNMNVLIKGYEAKRDKLIKEAKALDAKPNATQAEKDAMQKKIDDYKNQQFNVGGRTVGYDEYMQNYKSLQNAILKYNAGKARMQTNTDKFMKENGFYDEDKPFNPIKKQAFANSLSQSLVDNLNKGESDIYTNSGVTDMATAKANKAKADLALKKFTPSGVDVTDASDRLALQSDIIAAETAIELQRNKDLAKGNDLQKAKVADNYNNGASVFNELGEPSIDDVAEQTTSFGNTPINNLSAKDRADLLFYLGATYEDGGGTTTTDTRQGGTIGKYSKSMESTDDNLDATSVTTTDGSTTTDQGGEPYFGLTSKPTLQMDKATTAGFKQQATGYPGAILVDDATKPFFEDILKPIKDLDLSNGYSGMNASNTITLDDMQQRGFEMNFDGATTVYTPGYNKTMMYKVPIVKKAVNKGDANILKNDIETNTGNSGNVYFPIGEGGIHTKASDNKMSTPEWKTFAWLMETKGLTGNNGRYLANDVFDTDKLGVTDIQFDFENGKVYYRKDGKVSSNTINGDWSKLVDAFKLK